MNRKTYIYCLIACFTALSCLPYATQLLASLWGLILCVLLFIATWGVVWARMFGDSRLHPQFSLLTILPYAIFVYLIALDPALLESLQAPQWQNMYFIVWGLAALTLCLSLRPTAAEKKELEGRDSLGVFMMLITCIYSLSNWANCTYKLFPINN